MDRKELMAGKKRIVIKIGSSSLVHPETGDMDLVKMERLVRIVADISNSGKDVVLVSSGAIAVGRKTMKINERPKEKSVKQACAAIGQTRLMMVYQRLFAEYNKVPAQVLITKLTMIHDENRRNARATFAELLSMGVIPIVNENDTVVTDEIEFGDNDTLSAIVAALIHADLLIVLSDVDGFYDDNPKVNPNAKLIEEIDYITDDFEAMAGGAVSEFGTGGMATKVAAARIANDAGADTVICNADDMKKLRHVLEGRNEGTLFRAHKNENFHLIDYLNKKHEEALS
ncbi:MAG: glutamate 5-kinase [Lachnospiraceae bacterium]|nr:glutamate 5-kinase [Lachnospiraceae bacterium]MBO4788527.1 glutamate 5-kinase [Lachnospiraceae bacterium]MBQ2030945.1 glutamate 5-kinase [Lachnospiraceae bacterium]MCR5375434.1 glutamate 5-kinase [Lachnospiraceae bacterium]